VVIPFVDDTTGKPWQYISIRHDITDRKLAEQRILSVNTELERYKNAVDEVALVSITNSQGIITHVNDLYCQTSKYTREELVGANFMVLNSACHTEEFLQQIWATVSSGKTWKGEVMKMAKDGMPYWVDSNVIPFMYEQGQMWQFASISYDITDRKKAEEKILMMNTQLELRVKERTKQLEQKNNELESFVYTVSHDLRSPLRMINSYATLLAEAAGATLPDMHVQMLKNIKQYSADMNLIITDLLNLARIGSQPLVKQRVSLNSIAEACVHELKNETGANNAHVIIGDLGETEGDKGLLRQVFTNLISNALKYSTKVAEPRIEISRVVSGNNQVVYFVKDNGAGFDPENASRLFKPFQRMHTKEEFDGTGVGLFIVHTIITKHGGSIWAVSKENEGATFYFTLDENSSVQMKVA
jgi:PAS domain S-box-containing protein